VHRELLLVPPAVVRIEESNPIGPGYPREYTVREMREWAEASERLERVLQQDRQRPLAEQRLPTWLATPTGKLTPEQQRLVSSYQQLYLDRDKGINGTLDDQGRLILATGKHRTHYLCERAGASVPMWVSCADRQQLSAFRDECELHRTRIRDEQLREHVTPDHGRGALHRTVLPEVPPRERDTSRDERGS
jgi:hypothetical protein